MKKLTLPLIVIAASLVVGLTFVYAGIFSVAADEPHWSLTHRLIEATRERSIAIRARDVEPIALDDPALLAMGAEHYAEMCTGCHLAPGMKNTEIRAGLYPQPPNLVEHGAHRSAAESFWIIKHGLKMTGMPAWGVTHDDRSIWGMVAFLQKLPELSPPQYEELVAQGRSSGHAHDGEESGHSHGGGETVGPTDANEPAHDGGPDAHGATESPPPAPVHTHADRKQHVHETASGSPVDTAKALHEALSSGDASRVKALLDPKVLILESGGAERSQAEYAAHHLKADMDFMKTVTYRLERQTGDTVGDLAWVASESRMTGASKEKPVDIQSAETLVLKKTSTGWKVVHVHWSSRPVGDS